MEDDILAVWLLSRPILSGVAKGRFEHWCIKIHAGETILELDFGEKDTQGAFGLHHDNAIAAVSLDCLCYYHRNEDSEYELRQFDVVSSITPKFTTKGEDYVQREKTQHREAVPADRQKMFLSQAKDNVMFVPFWINQLHEHTLQEAEKNNDDCTYEDQLKQARKELVRYLTLPKFNRKLSDIATFLAQWTQKHSTYDAIFSNCQRFAYDLFAYLVEEVPNKQND
ncbi:hypothetical protein RFI_13676, partial [Reticulomyxa filosa]